MPRGLRHYQNPIFEAASPRESEIVAFSLANSALQAAVDPCDRIRALLKNQQLWSAILKDVAQDENGLPTDLKTRIAELSGWVMAYSTVAMTQPLSVEPLLQINNDMIEGLRAQAGNALPTPIPTTAGAAALA